MLRTIFVGEICTPPMPQGLLSLSLLLLLLLLLLLPLFFIGFVTFCAPKKTPSSKMRLGRILTICLFLRIGKMLDY